MTSQQIVKSDSATAADWQALRHQMPVTGRWAYFDHAAVAPLPRPSADAIRDWAEDATASGDANWGRWQRRLEEARTLGAALMGAQPEEIALVRNTTEGVTLVAEGFPWREGDNVVLPSCEFPSNRFAWMNLASRGVEARLVPCASGRVELDDVAKACDRRTRLIAASWIDYATGWRNDPSELARLAHDKGALLFLDAIQGLGVFPLDARAAGVDFLAADGHKWLLGPEGAGLLYVAREHLDLLRPFGVGWNSVEHAGDFTRPEMRLKNTAARYEGGTYPVGTFVGLAESLRLLSRFSATALAERLLNITDAACNRLARIGALIQSDRTAGRRSGIVAFDIPSRDPQQLRLHCRQHGVLLAYRAGHLRLSPHAYNNEDDLDRLIDALTKLNN
jgi:selenocysteine lyase/cysteine desulfurase